MTRPRTSLAAALLILLASCGSQAASVSTASSTPAAVGTPVPHAPEIRFALVGEVTNTNVWALFDAKGYSYNNYAVRSEYWPRLYRLSIPERQFEPMAASGMPSPMQHDGDFYTASVPLRSDLNWTDGTPFTAEDVAFTINTALSFQLGFDWHDYYDPQWLDHVEAVDAHTVKFYFKKAPNVGAWQYGALQGPIVQKSYWLPKIAAPRALLPSSDLASQIEAFKARVADLQKQVDALNLSAATAPASGEEARQNQMTLNRQQRDLNAATSDLAKAQSDFAAAMNAARTAMYALDHADEPTLGNWIPAGQENGAWVNKVNPAHPFGEPKFDRAVYVSYIDENLAVRSFQHGEINAILSQQGLSLASVNTELGAPIISNLSSTIHFIIINPDESLLIDTIVRRALFCSIDVDALAKAIGASPLISFVLKTNDGWFAPQSVVSCGDESDKTSKQKAVALLKTSGYSWAKEPSDQSPGEGLAPPHAAPLPPQRLLAPDQLSDFQVAATAQQIQEAAQYLGLTVTVEISDPTDIRYAVFSNHQYDMAVLGWQVSEYPGYLCDWFGGGNPFGYHSDRLQSACEALNSTSDLDKARQQVYEIQSTLAQDLPFIPLYSGMTYDAYRNIAYPFDSVLGGLSGVYGAPSLAIPASP